MCSRSTLHIVLVNLVLVITAGLCGSILGRFYRGAAKARGGSNFPLTVDEGALDFGSAWEQDGFIWSLPVTNTGKEPVSVARFSSSCTCTEITPGAFEIAPGETRAVVVKLDLRSATAKDAGKELRPFAVYLTPVLDNRREGRAWHISGHVRRSVRVTPTALDFGHHSELAPMLPVRFAVDACNGVDEVRVSPVPGFGVSIARTSAGGERRVVTLTPKVLPRGEVKHEVVVTAYRDGVVLPGLAVPLRGRVLDDLEFTPAHVLFGVHPVGTTPMECVTLRSLSGRAFEVLDVQTGGNGLAVTRGAAAGHDYTFRLHITGPGRFAYSSRFRVRDGEAKVRDLALEVSGVGIPAE